MAQKSREEGEIGSESRKKGDLPPCSSPLFPVLVHVFNIDLFEFSAAILEKGVLVWGIWAISLFGA